jgi:predicted double-glycine peptidase
MALGYLGRATDYAQLIQLLKIKSFGAPAGNIRLLTTLGVTPIYSQTDMPGLETLLQQQQPVIVFVRTGDLPHWTYNTDHALVVVGYDENNVYVNDPDRQNAPIAVPRNNFELAWLERDYYYASITR